MFNVSIITVCFNSEKTIQQTINSVNNQNYKLVEHIFIDGLSNDNTVNIIKKNMKSNYLLISEKDDGIYDAMNKGIKLAKGDIILILNSDDIFYENCTLDNIIDTFKKDNFLDLIYGDIIITKNEKIVRNWIVGEYKKNSFLKGWCPAHPAFVAKKSTYRKFGLFNLKYKSAADIEIMYRFLDKYNCKYAYCNKILVNMSAGGRSNKNIKNIFFQNIENVKIFKNEKSFNIIKFFFYKIIHRLKQFL